MLTMQSLSNLVQSGSIQIVNDINGQYQEFTKYDMQVGYFMCIKNISIDFLLIYIYFISVVISQL